MRIQTALFSTHNKTGVVPFAQVLSELGIGLLATGGTYSLLHSNGIRVTELSEYTGFPEMMDGRVKTLHPKIHAGILARPGVDDLILDKFGIKPIELVVVNLYPFETVIGEKGTTIEKAIETIDIGGPTLLRAAAKNYSAVGVVVDPNDYLGVSEEIKKHGGRLLPETRQKLAVKAFRHVAHYDAVIMRYLAGKSSVEEKFPETLTLTFRKHQDLRYGENPHQAAACYREVPGGGWLSDMTVLQGKTLSFNNLLDSDQALVTVQEFQEPCCVIVKHGNPCGVACGKTILEAYQAAYGCDPVSAFGGVIAINRSLEEALLKAIFAQQFSEVILAPDISQQAERLATQKPQVRIARVSFVAHPKRSVDLRKISDGILVQEEDLGIVSRSEMKGVTQKTPSEKEWRDLLFAWRVVKHVKSNAIVYAKDQRTLGIGAGQMSRVDSVKLGAQKAKDNGFDLQGSVMASDAFFPFPDSVELAAQEGVTALIQPGGSIRDKEVVNAANRQGMSMVLTGMRHFRH
ncbi:MAG: bifunctional phosphoribosylaminoimidazolecarboxamide formyltransferase/IMP cyclohydrolase [Gammaproteobacteria bacterium]|nr:bifunctional phosphoribosylaminoimidazolecarboxamide formyltransferase/IMP cyclohydrolase [Gammaproteobacteria bacterium]